MEISGDNNVEDNSSNSDNVTYVGYISEVVITGTKLEEGQSRLKSRTKYEYSVGFGTKVPVSETYTEFYHAGSDNLSAGWHSQSEYFSEVYDPLMYDYSNYVYGNETISGEGGVNYYNPSNEDRSQSYQNYAEFVTSRDMADWILPSLNANAKDYNTKIYDEGIISPGLEQVNIEFELLLLVYSFGGSTLVNATANSGGRIFYVGEGAESLARNIASQTGSKTIYNTWYGTLGQGVSPFLSQPIKRKMWGHLSTKFANGAKFGDDIITVFGRHRSTGLHTLPINSKAAWKTIEFPILNSKGIQFKSIFTN